MADGREDKDEEACQIYEPPANEWPFEVNFDSYLFTPVANNGFIESPRAFPLIRRVGRVPCRELSVRGLGFIAALLFFLGN